MDSTSVEVASADVLALMKHGEWRQPISWEPLSERGEKPDRQCAGCKSHTTCLPSVALMCPRTARSKESPVILDA